jgi:hypothetical protein
MPITFKDMKKAQTSAKHNVLLVKAFMNPVRGNNQAIA